VLLYVIRHPCILLEVNIDRTHPMPTERPRLHISLLPGYRRLLIREAIRQNRRDPSPSGLAAQIVEEWIHERQARGELPEITEDDQLVDQSSSIKDQIAELLQQDP
jgi:uncharacterized protein YjiS (DUF1127 family)